MGFLSKLFGNDANAEKTAKDLLGSIFSGASQSQDRPAQSPAAAPAVATEYEKMPDEENQYNFSGTYTEYFEMIFMQELPALSFEKADRDIFGNTAYTFYSAGQKKLVVELMTERSGARRVRNACEAERVPYLRFYYDHDGWWNTRSYVARRLHSAVL